MSRTLWTWARLLGSALTLAILVWRLGTGPFLAGLHAVNGWALAAAAGLAVLTTVCSAWRWKVVAGGLGVGLSMRAAVAAYYRSLFLNLVLPGGIGGDVHRGVSHGRDVSDLSRALRSVAWERLAGQVVQILLAAIVLLALPSPVHSLMPLVAVALGATMFAIVLVTRLRPARGPSWLKRIHGAAAGDIRAGLLARRAWLSISLASVLVVGGHAATFLIAARTAGTAGSPFQMLPIALLVMVVTAVPSVGGWGPREGAAAWAFGAAGLGAQHGVATAVAYGVMMLVASLPGAAVLVLAWIGRDRSPERARPRVRDRAAHA
jgi:glycosyltransferase 2 family protein